MGAQDRRVAIREEKDCLIARQGYRDAQNRDSLGGMSANVHQQSVRRTFGVRTAQRHADIRRRNGPHGREWYAFRHHA